MPSSSSSDTTRLAERLSRRQLIVGERRTRRPLPRGDYCVRQDGITLDPDFAGVSDARGAGREVAKNGLWTADGQLVATAEGV